MLMPLHYFYAEEGGEMPAFEFVRGDEVPEPERSLLVHTRDMTSTLRRHHGADIALEVIASQRSDDYLMRMVVLRNAATGAPVEFGAIGVRLEVFEGPIQADIAEARGPLGGLLEKYLIDYRSAPKGYFRTWADHRIGGALDEPDGAICFGRCNELTDADGIAFADIVEVLPRA